MLTITDFINILHCYYKSPMVSVNLLHCGSTCTLNLTRIFVACLWRFKCMSWRATRLRHGEVIHFKVNNQRGSMRWPLCTCFHSSFIFSSSVSSSFTDFYLKYSSHFLISISPEARWVRITVRCTILTRSKFHFVSSSLSSQPIWCRLFLTQVQDPQAACHWPSVWKRPAYSHPQKNPQVSPYICE